MWWCCKENSSFETSYLALYSLKVKFHVFPYVINANANAEKRKRNIETCTRKPNEIQINEFYSALTLTASFHAKIEKAPQFVRFVFFPLCLCGFFFLSMSFLLPFFLSFFWHSFFYVYDVWVNIVQRTRNRSSWNIYIYIFVSL